MHGTLLGRWQGKEPVKNLVSGIIMISHSKPLFSQLAQGRTCDVTSSIVTSQKLGPRYE